MAVPWSCVGGEGRLKWQVEAGEGLLRAGGRQWRMATHSSQFQGPVRKGNRSPSFGIGCAGQIGRVVNSSGSIKVTTSGVGGAVQENNAADELATCGTLFSCSMFKRCSQCQELWSLHPWTFPGQCAPIWNSALIGQPQHVILSLAFLPRAQLVLASREAGGGRAGGACGASPFNFGAFPTGPMLILGARFPPFPSPAPPFQSPAWLGVGTGGHWTSVNNRHSPGSCKMLSREQRPFIQMISGPI